MALRVQRDMLSVVLYALMCEATFLCASWMGFWFSGQPLDYDHWGGRIIAAIILLPQAMVIPFVVWRIVLREHINRSSLARMGCEATLLGMFMGLLFWSVGSGLKWFVPWLIPLVS